MHPSFGDRCEGALRAQQTWLSVRPACPIREPELGMGGSPAKAKSPARWLATPRIPPAIMVPEKVPYIAGRWRYIAAFLEGQKACEAAGGTLVKDGCHRF